MVINTYKFDNPEVNQWYIVGNLWVNKKARENSIDKKTMEYLCIWLNCQPSDIMEVIPNTWENADRLCEILDCERNDLPNRVPMEEDE